jgi:hypothetical protein
MVEFAPTHEIKKIPDLIKDLFEYVLYEQGPNIWISDEATIFDVAIATPDEVLLRVIEHYRKPVTAADLEQPLWKLLLLLNEGRSKFH